MNPIAARAMLLLTLGGGLIPPHCPVRPAPVRATLLSGWSLRDYQLDMLLEAARFMSLGVRRILLQLPTGGGKTVMAQAMLGSAQRLELLSQFIVHRKELVEQTSKTFAGGGLKHGFVASGYPADYDANLILAGVQTLANRLDLVLPPNLIVLDEAHHATADTWARTLAEFPEAFVVGLTATPERLDGRGLDDHFDVMIEGPSVAELIARGFLSSFDYFAPGVPDLSKARTDAAAAEIMDKPTLIGDMVEHYLRLAAGQPGIVFASNREHSRHLVDAFQGSGVRALHVDGDMSQKERERADAAFRAREVDLLSNVDLFGEGYDVPGIVYCGLGRRTQSLALYRQQVGRDLRPVYADGMPINSDAARLAAIAAGPKPRGIICDHAGNVFQHGFPDEDIEWSLQGKAGRPRGASDDATPVKQCMTCYRVSRSIVSICPGCGTEFVVVKRRISVAEGQLARLEREELKRRQAQQRRIEEQNCKSHADFVSLARARGYDEPEKWAKVKMKTRATAAARWNRR